MASGFELSTLFPDYSMSGMPEWTGYILSAVVGVALLVIFFKIVSSLMKDKVDFKKKAASHFRKIPFSFMITQIFIVLRHRPS